MNKSHNFLNKVIAISEEYGFYVTFDKVNRKQIYKYIDNLIECVYAMFLYGKDEAHVKASEDLDILLSEKEDYCIEELSNLYDQLEKHKFNDKEIEEEIDIVKEWRYN